MQLSIDKLTACFPYIQCTSYWPCIYNMYYVYMIFGDAIAHYADNCIRIRGGSILHSVDKRVAFFRSEGKIGYRRMCIVAWSSRCHEKVVSEVGDPPFLCFRRCIVPRLCIVSLLGSGFRS